MIIILGISHIRAMNECEFLTLNQTYPDFQFQMFKCLTPTQQLVREYFLTVYGPFYEHQIHDNKIQLCVVVSFSEI